MATLDINYLGICGTRYYLNGSELFSLGSLTQKNRIEYILARPLIYGANALSEQEAQTMLDFAHFRDTNTKAVYIRDEAKNDWYYQSVYANQTFRMYTLEHADTQAGLMVLTPELA